jgi:hypothetical protein
MSPERTDRPRRSSRWSGLGLLTLWAALGGAAGCSSPPPAAPDAGPADAASGPDADSGAPDADAAPPDDRGPSPYPLDDVLRLNHVQARGTHNSYHVAEPMPTDPSYGYTQAPLDEQLDKQGVRQLELDIHYRTGSGFEVFHVPIVDSLSTCQHLVDCLTTIKTWSDAHPWHMPLTIWIEPKDDVDTLDPTLEKLSGKWDELESVILSVWPRQRIFTPDDLRGEHPDLPTAVMTDGWPTLGKLRGKVLFSMLDSSKYRDEYTAPAANLAGRLMFVDADTPDDPFAALFKIDDAQADAAEVTSVVMAGFIVTSNVDEAGQKAADNQAKHDASLAAGIHHGSSDYPAPVDGYDYFMQIPDGMPARCNPVYPAVRCTPLDIENLP